MARLYPENYEGTAPIEFGTGANILKTRTFNLTNARDLELIDIGGSCLWAVTASSLGAQIDIRINDQLRDPVTFQQGMFIRGVPFSRLYVSHAAQAGESITIFFAREQDVRNIEIINPAIAFTEVNLTKGTILSSGGDVTIAAAGTGNILAANANRRVAFISSLTTNINILRVGDAGVSATRGLELAPGESFGVKSSAQIVAFNPGPLDQIVSRIWTED